MIEACITVAKIIIVYKQGIRVFVSAHELEVKKDCFSLIGWMDEWQED